MSIGLDQSYVNKRDYIFGRDMIAFDNICMLLKYYVYKLRRNETRFSEFEFLHEVKLRYISDQIYMSPVAFDTKWRPIQQKIEQSN